MQGVDGLDVRLTKPPLADVLDQSDGPWEARLAAGATFHTFTRPRKFRKEPAKPAGLESCDQATLERWRSACWEVAPYQFTAEKLLWKGEEWRQLRAVEREVMLGYPRGYTEPAGDAFHRKQVLGDTTKQPRELIDLSFQEAMKIGEPHVLRALPDKV